MRQKHRIGVHRIDAWRHNDRVARHAEHKSRGRHDWWACTTCGGILCNDSRTGSDRPAARAQRYFGGERRSVTRFWWTQLPTVPFYFDEYRAMRSDPYPGPKEKR